MSPEEIRQFNNLQREVGDLAKKLNSFFDKFERMNLIDKFLLSKPLTIQKTRIDMLYSRLQEAKGVDVASAGDLTLGLDGNSFTITGTTTVNAIVNGTWKKGASVTLIFSGATTVKHNTAGSTGTSRIFLAGSADLVTATNTVLGLWYDGTQWQETFRKVA